MQTQLEGKGITALFQYQFGNLIEQLLLHMNQSMEECVKRAVKSAIQEIGSTQTASKEDELDGFLTRAETLKFLQVSAPSLLRYQKAGLLKYSKIGRKVYFRKSDLVNATQVNVKQKGGRRWLIMPPF